jgi:acetyl esterase/lipase
MKPIGMFVAFFWVALAFIPTASGSVDTQAVELAFEEIGPPPEEVHAIRLSGKSENPNPETWLRMRGTKAPPWWLGPCGPLVIRNVSQTALIPFLPDPAKATGAAVILAPGGGTLVHCMDVQYQMAKWLNDRGIAAFVLKYRLVPTPKDLSAFLGVVERRPPVVYSDIIPEKIQLVESATTHKDGLEAVRYVRTHASRFKVSPNRIGFMGFSAGGFTAVGVALEADHSSRPDLVALIYGSMPGEITVDASAPPIFIAATSDDPLYSIGASVDPYLNIYRAWQQAHIPAEIHMFATGGHGFGITPRAKSSDQWSDLLDHWLQERGFAANDAKVQR